MDYSQWQQPPAPATQPAAQPAGVNQSAVDAYYASYYAYYASLPSQSQNPNPNSICDSKTHESSVAAAAPQPGSEAHVDGGSNPDSAAAGYQTADTASYYSSDANAQNWAWKEAVRLYGADPSGYAAAGVAVRTNGSEQSAMAYPGPAWTSHPGQVQLHGNVSRKKRPKKVKIVQSAYCEVCEVDCNSQGVLEQHKLGKKHQKKLEKLQACASSNTGSASGGSSVPVIGPQENPDKSNAANCRKIGKKAAASMEDLETKKRKVVECGVAAESVRTCTICNVVCNSEKVYIDHLAGQKHATMARKHTAQAGVAPVNS